MDNELAVQDNDKYPWDVMPGETPEKFDAFRRFRDLPPSTRSIGALIRATQKLGIDIKLYESTLRRWMKEYRWIERCGAWDSHLDKIWQGEHIAAVREAARRHLYESQELQSKGMEALRLLHPVDLADKPQEVRKYIGEGAQLERDTLGMNSKEKGGTEVTVVNPITIIKIAEELEKKGSIIDLPAEDYVELEGAQDGGN